MGERLLLDRAAFCASAAVHAFEAFIHARVVCSLMMRAELVPRWSASTFAEPAYTLQMLPASL